MSNEQDLENEDREQTIHEKNFEKWIKEIPEERQTDIYNFFYSRLRQSNGLLVDLDYFYYLAWTFLTLEGKQLIELTKAYMKKVEEKMIEENDLDVEVEPDDTDRDGRYHRFAVRWKIGHKSLMFDLYYYFYNFLLDDSGDLMEFEEFLFNIWEFSTLEGRESRIEKENEYIEDHKD